MKSETTQLPQKQQEQMCSQAFDIMACRCSRRRDLSQGKGIILRGGDSMKKKTYVRLK